MSAIKWTHTWFIIILLIPLTGLFNYAIDPYGFNKFFLINNMNSVKEENPFVIKYKMPRLKNGKWSNLLLGTSRIGVMDTIIVDKYLGGKTFSMSLPLSAMPVQFDSFLYAVKFNKIKNIIYGIDFMTFNKNLKLNDDYVQFKNELRSFGQFYTYDIYFNIKTLNKSIYTIQNNISGQPKHYPFYTESGMRNYPDFEQRLSSGYLDVETEISKHIKMYFKEGGVYSNYEYSSEYMQMFKKVVKYCRENEINLYVYIPPIYFKHFYAIREAGLKKEFEKFKKELVKITDFIDFTGINSVTINKNNFLDSSHLEKELTGAVMDKLFKPTNSTIYLDFGTMVTKENIEEHLKDQHNQYRKINLENIVTTIYSN